jgi:hypothetical protein
LPGASGSLSDCAFASAKATKMRAARCVNSI